MTKFEFMEELENLLSDIPIEERNEAIQYYNDYFEDAGADHEDEILRELVSPARVAGIIKADLCANVSDHENRGNYTEKGYQDTVYVDEKFEIERTVKQKEKDGPATNDINQGTTSGAGGNGTGSTGAKNNTPKSVNVALIILICFLAIPVGIPIFFSIFGIFIAFAATVFSLFIAFGIAGVVMITVGFALFASGLLSLSIPFQSLAFCGAGLLVFGLGMLFLILSILLCGKVLPAMFRGIVNLFRLPFKNRSVMA